MRYASQSWVERFRQFFGVITPDIQPDVAKEIRLEIVRSAMVAAGIGCSEGSLVLKGIHAAEDLRALWYLRTDLMYELALQIGETEARSRLIAVSTLFGPTGFRATPRR